MTLRPALLALLLVGCTEAASPDRVDTTPPADTGDESPITDSEPTTPDAWVLTPVEQELFDAINAYRAANFLPAVPFSPSLSRVARIHSIDLNNEAPNQGQYNLHSWSDAGTLRACSPDRSEP